MLNGDQIIPFLTDLNYWITYTPSLTFLLVASRGLLFWAFNAVAVCLVLAFGREYARKIPTTHKPAPVQRPDFGYERDEQIHRNNVGFYKYKN